MSTFKYIYSEEHQALLDQMQEHIDEYSEILLDKLNREFEESRRAKPNRDRMSVDRAYFSNDGRTELLKAYVALKSSMIPVSIKFKIKRGDV